MTQELCQCNIHDHAKCAGRVPIFASLDPQELREVVSLIRRKKYEKDSYLLYEGDIGTHLFIVSRGRIKVFGSAPDGKEHLMYVLSTGEFYGARDLIQVKESELSVQAMEETHVCMIAKSDFQKLLVRFPGIALKVMEDLCDRLEKMEALAKKISPRDVDSRINAMIMELANRYGRPHEDGTLVDLPMSREDMAKYIGVARETVSRKLATLKDEGIIRMLGNRQMLILKEKSL